MGETLSAEASFSGGADFQRSLFEWYRVPKQQTGSSHQEAEQRLTASGPSYQTTADDVNCEIVVRVTPVAPTGQQGTMQQAASSAPIGVASDIHSTIHEWVDIGQRRFDGCIEGDKERQLLMTTDKLKVRDKSGKTLVKDSYTTLRMELMDDPLSFVLQFPGNKRGSITLRAPTSMVRNLISLAIIAFRDPQALKQMLLAPSTTPNLHHSLATLASHGLGHTGDPDSPASSFTSEQPSIADVQDTADRNARKGFLGRKLSFDRGKKK